MTFACHGLYVCLLINKYTPESLSSRLVQDTGTLCHAAGPLPFYCPFTSPFTSLKYVGASYHDMLPVWYYSRAFKSLYPPCNQWVVQQLGDLQNNTYVASEAQTNRSDGQGFLPISMMTDGDTVQPPDLINLFQSMARPRGNPRRSRCHLAYLRTARRMMLRHFRTWYLTGPRQLDSAMPFGRCIPCTPRT